MMNFDRTKFHSRLKQARREARLKQEQVARYLRIPISAVSALESGTRKADAIELFVLSKIYNKNLLWFFRDYSEDSLGSVQAFEDPESMLRDCFTRLKKAPPNVQRYIVFQIVTLLNDAET